MINGFNFLWFDIKLDVWYGIPRYSFHIHTKCIVISARTGYVRKQIKGHENILGKAKGERKLCVNINFGIWFMTPQFKRLFCPFFFVLSEFNCLCSTDHPYTDGCYSGIPGRSRIFLLFSIQLYTLGSSVGRQTSTNTNPSK